MIQSFNCSNGNLCIVYTVAKDNGGFEVETEDKQTVDKQMVDICS